MTTLLAFQAFQELNNSGIRPGASKSEKLHSTVSPHLNSGKILGYSATNPKFKVAEL